MGALNFGEMFWKLSSKLNYRGRFCQSFWRVLRQNIENHSNKNQGECRIVSSIIQCNMNTPQKVNQFFVQNEWKFRINCSLTYITPRYSLWFHSGSQFGQYIWRLICQFYIWMFDVTVDSPWIMVDNIHRVSLNWLKIECQGKFENKSWSSQKWLCIS